MATAPKMDPMVPASPAENGTSLRRVVQTQLLRRREQLEQAQPEIQTPQLVRLMKEVDLALERIDHGAFGVCEHCHGSVEDEQLLTNPLARFCLECLPPEQQRMLERDLELAAQIQMRLLPKRNMRVDGWNVAYHYRPFGVVSGDYCDLISGPDETLYFLLGDVSGKGVASSMLMANLNATFRTLVPLGIPLSQMVERANRVFSESTLPMQFATLISGKVTPDGGLELVNAGHNPAVVCTKEGVEVVEASAMPLGMFADQEFQSTRFTLSKGDAVLLYTDGISEAVNAKDQEYGLERLTQLIFRCREAGTARLLEDCIEDLTAFREGAPAFDDETLMLVQRVA
ncbi:MAG TPA: SpoIIE family protein phosphatase [Terriglobales bacterium]|nr:SpoIIE family protein phosphatase [Terriglobales bacterium]